MPLLLHVCANMVVETAELTMEVVLTCLGNVKGPRLLDGRTGNGTVGLAPTTEAPFTGTRWQVGIPFGDDNRTIPADE
ncbi:hypothetical protein [Kitasatospora sp. NPDC094015]|uniref:hypothetical protein n=1 Tax=Kitasatospora sp. NPDC094015 TaxID=3155205 RepID=UPI0033299CF5